MDVGVAGDRHGRPFLANIGGDVRGIFVGEPAENEDRSPVVGRSPNV
jgi:hypothetical protein